MYETSTVTPARHNAHPQDRSDEARRSCDVEVLGAAPDPGSRDLRHARKRRTLARPVGDAVGRCRREVARTRGDAPEPASRRAGEARPRGRVPDGRWVTDVVGPHVPAGRAYLSPIAGRLNGMPLGDARCEGLIGRPETGFSCGYDRGGAATGELAGMLDAYPGWHGDARTRSDPGHGSPTRHGRNLGSAARTWDRRRGCVLSSPE